MKITDVHARILRRVQSVSAGKGSLGGAAQWEIDFGTKGLGTSLNAMVRHGILEKFVTTQKVRLIGDHGSTHHDPNGHTLYRVGPAGAAYLLDIAYGEENRLIESRIARRMIGVPPHAIEKAILLKHRWEFLLNPVADEVRRLVDSK